MAVAKSFLMAERLTRVPVGGGATRPLPSDGGVEELHGDPTQQSGHAPRSGPEVKSGRSGAEDGAPERHGCGTIKEEVSRILQRVSTGPA